MFADGMGRQTGASRGGGMRGRQQKDPDFEVPVEVTLEEMYLGCTKKRKITRKMPGGQREEKVLSVEVRPGWKAGTKVRFENEGDDRGDGSIPADIVFVIRQKPHGSFRRDGNDLVLKQTVPLWSALTGFTTKLHTLDGRELRVACPEGARPGAIKTVPGEGMPLSKNPSARGNLRIEFSIKFPPASAFAEDEQRKAHLRAALNGI